MTPTNTENPKVSAEAFRALFAELAAWGRWGEDDERGALHHLTEQLVATAARDVRQGLTVTLSLPLNTPSAIYSPTLPSIT